MLVETSCQNILALCYKTLDSMSHEITELSRTCGYSKEMSEAMHSKKHAQAKTLILELVAACELDRSAKALINSSDIFLLCQSVE